MRPRFWLVHRLTCGTVLAVSGTTEDATGWAANVGASGLSQKASPLFDSNLLAIEAAISGQGVVVVPEFLVKADIAAGNLVVPFGSTIMQPGGMVPGTSRASRQRESHPQVSVLDGGPGLIQREAACNGREVP